MRMSVRYSSNIYFIHLSIFEEWEYHPRDLFSLIAEHASNLNRFELFDVILYCEVVRIQSELALQVAKYD